MNNLRKIIVVLFILIVCLTIVSMLGASSSLAEAPAQSPKDVTALIAKARANGTVPVIVGVRAPFQPEGRLANPTAVRNQRASIRTAQDALLTKLANYNVQSVRKFDYIPFMAMWVNADALTFLVASPEVTSIEEDVPEPLALAESVPLIGAPTVWASGYTGAGQVIAVLDTGVDKTHPFLTGKVVSEACYSNGGGGGTSVCPGGVNSTAPGSGVNCSMSISGCDHGTHVAGIAAGKDNGSIGFSGVAKDANVIAIQVFTQFGTSLGTYSSDQILGLQRVQTLAGSYAIASVNMSLGGGRYYDQASCDSANPSRKAAIDNLRSLNIATVIASGNNGYTDSMSAPGCISTAVSVGATGDGSSGTTTDAVMSYSNSVSFLNLLAPGSKIYSSTPGNTWGNWDGTSMATPHVAGAWALLKQKVPGATVSQVLTALTSTGLPVTDPRNNVTKPRIRVNLAINALGPPPVFVYLPLVLKDYPPPLPGVPTLNPINNPSNSGNYNVTWTSSLHATSYLLEEANDPSFSSPTTVYNGAGTSWSASGKPNGTYHYRVKARNVTGDSGWSNTQSTTVSGGTWVTLVNTTFEGDFPGSWTVFDNNGSSYGVYHWAARTCRPFAGSFSGWGVGGGTNGSALGCGSNYPNYADSWMQYGPFSLVGATAADLKFKLWLNTESTYDFVCRLASINGTDFYGYCTTGNFAGWIDRTLDLTTVPTLGNLLGQPNVWVALVFYSDSSVTYAEGGYVDNVVLRRCPSGTCPAGASQALPSGSRIVEFPMQMTLPRR